MSADPFLQMADADATTDLCWIHHEETTDIKLHVKNRSVTTVPRLEFFLLIPVSPDFLFTI